MSANCTCDHPDGPEHYRSAPAVVNNGPDMYWRDLVRFHVEEADKLRAENARLNGVIAEAVADAESVLRIRPGTEWDLGIKQQARDTLDILATAAQTDKEAGA